MRALDSGLLSRLNGVATAPGAFVELGFSIVQRWSNRGPITWNSQSWSSVGFSALYQAGSKGAQSDRVTLSLNNHDNVIGALLLGTNFAGLTIKLYLFDGDSPATAEVTKAFEGVGDVFSLTPTKCTMSFVSTADDIRRLPYARIVRSAVRQTITPPGTVITWNNERYELTN
jgi:hypothetical protein